MKINLYKFKESASQDLRDFFERKTTTSAVHRMLCCNGLCFQRTRFSEFCKPYDYWWVNSSEAINLLKENEDFSLERIKERAELELATINRSVITNITLAVCIIVLIVLLVAVIIKEIASSVSKIKLAAERMTTGEVDFTVDVTSKDEIGDLAMAFNRMISVTKEYSQVADAIGRGHYESTVKTRVILICLEKH